MGSVRAFRRSIPSAVRSAWLRTWLPGDLPQRGGGLQVHRLLRSRGRGHSVVGRSHAEHRLAHPASPVFGQGSTRPHLRCFVRLVITGGAGMLARAVQQVAGGSKHEVVALPREALDVTDEKAVLNVLRKLAPDVVIHCAAYTRVDEAESDPDAAFLVNSLAADFVARACATIGTAMVYPSTDYVFAGTASRPYEATD